VKRLCGTRTGATSEARLAIAGRHRHLQSPDAHAENNGGKPEFVQLGYIANGSDTDK
jgi:hypothetical protein